MLLNENLRLDTSHIRHDFELSVERRTTCATEEVLVDLAAVSLGIPGLR